MSITREQAATWFETMHPPGPAAREMYRMAAEALRAQSVVERSLSPRESLLGGDGDAGGDRMTLYDILRVTRYWQKFCCYVTNVYDQNVPIGFGTRRELLDEEQNDKLFDYLMCDVDSISITKDKSLLIRVRDEHYNHPLEEQYECTGAWKVSDPVTRPFKFSGEMEDFEYYG